MNPPQLNTPRLSLRPVTLPELGKIHELHSFPEVDAFNTLGLPENQEQTRAILTDLIAKHTLADIRNFTFSVYLKSEDIFIGLTALNLGNPKYKSAEIWFKFHPEHWHKGYATEAIKALITFGFTALNLHRIEAGCAVGNIGSYKAMEKAGMVREGRKRLAIPLKTGWSDNYEYAIVAPD